MKIEASVPKGGHVEGSIACDPNTAWIFLIVSIVLLVICTYAGAGFSRRSLNPWTWAKEIFVTMNNHRSNTVALLIYLVLAATILSIAGLVVTTGACVL